MKYALLIYTDENTMSGAPEDALREMYQAFGTFNQALRAAGKFGPAEELASSSTAKSVRIRDGQRLVTDGPFAEVREQLGGIYVIEAADMDEALDWAARVPSAPFGTIEVRPVAPGMYPEAG
jgi:hypothetical protein